MNLREQAAKLFPFNQSDHKAWAKRIIWRMKNGDKTLLQIQIKFALEALSASEAV